MSKVGKLSGLKPERVFYYFEELTRIPRCSNEEKMVSDYLKGVGLNLGLEVIQDEVFNIVIKKPGTRGYENKPTVVLQGHMDMVCEKADDVDFDFSKDSINIAVEGDYIVAEETTLGADNGIAVAMCLAILESKDIAHPPLEVLVTTNEETGLTGAAELDPKHISGRTLINIDSEEEGTILVSCAGGERNIITIPLKWEGLEEGKASFILRISGLLGGHSGMEIDKGRGNSIKILGRVLNKINEELDFELASVDGGSKSNAIPRLALAKIATNKNDIEKLKKIVDNISNEIKLELATSDKDVSITLEKIDSLESAFTKEITNNIITALMLIPSGIQSMSQDIIGLIESSNNLGVLKTYEDKVTIECAMRSSVGSLKSNIAIQLKLIAQAINAHWLSTSAYPAWEYKKDSYIREVFKKSYKELYNKELEVAAIHAGLECGLFKEKFGEIDMVSFGPNMKGVHAPGESLSISSTERTFELLKKVLENI
ncbi:aminoacyl-histidine dipeptidase [Tissierella sp. Yu-01]|uniref:aminoacyl-histidine dipeptidase n=1 Tax=Tissierella sp. Yu-01 TaxID=3035694 RepID=UPI00240D616C|nr:aminoacyl-histidine dipeptidase [Tissierella sp. Yu-01]WFA10420.1 aminoacyl-histidine dipeptidase [Tissierella sp. Yu-01]